MPRWRPYFFHTSHWNQRCIQGSRDEISLGKSIKRDRRAFICNSDHLLKHHTIHHSLYHWDRLVRQINSKTCCLRCFIAKATKASAKETILGKRNRLVLSPTFLKGASSIASISKSSAMVDLLNQRQKRGVLIKRSEEKNILKDNAQLQCVSSPHPPSHWRLGG